MYGDDRGSTALCAVALDDRLVYLAFQGAHSSIAVYKQDDMSFVGCFMQLCGSAQHLIVDTPLRKLICCTTSGYIYVWDVGEDTVERLQCITNDPLTSDGFVHQDLRVLPLVEVSSDVLGDCVEVDHVPGSSTLLGVSCTGVLSQYDIATGAKIGSVYPLEGEDNQVHCLKVDTQVSTFRDRKGHWVAIGGAKGAVALSFVPLQSDADGGMDLDEPSAPLFDAASIYSAAHNAGGHSDVNSIAFRYKSANSVNVTLLCGCSDGAVRCVVFQHGEGELQPHKSAAYVHCRGAKGGVVSRVLADRGVEGWPYMLSLCNMKLPCDFYAAPCDDGRASCVEASTFCAEILLQKLLQDQSEQLELLAQVRDVITDMKVAASQECIVFTTFDDLFIIRRDVGGSGWLKPDRIEWNSAENQKLMAKLL